MKVVKVGEGRDQTTFTTLNIVITITYETLVKVVKVFRNAGRSLTHARRGMTGYGE